MADSRVAYRYVKSLLQLAVEQKALEEVNNDMMLFAQVCDRNRAFTLMLRNPVVKHDKKNEILRAVFRGRVHNLTLAIFDIITRKNREPLLPEIARQFHNAYNEYKGIVKASLTTAFPVDKALRMEFETIVKKISTSNLVEMVEKVDQQMIGGFVLTVGDKQIDASISNQLKTLEREFSQNPYIKEI
ncbi:MAG: ATP synthase F1 subunit delta [Cyclobacteriaceae bacterium]